MKTRQNLKKIVGLGCCIIAGFGAALCLGTGSARSVAADWDSRCIPDDSFFTESVVEGEPETPKRVFLTFDDGPSPTTEKILDILEEKEVPATFFVIAAENNEEYLPILERTVAEGHQIALHSCSHEYSKIYQSPEDFWNDIKELKQKLEPYADPDTLTWLRFPGGSTNTVSRRYGGSGIMKTLKTQAEQAGYRYLDWNLCAEDAQGGHPDAQEIFRNVTRDVGDKHTCVVLMHDTKATKTTAEALPDIIDWFRENGYQFCRVDELEREENQGEE